MCLNIYSSLCVCATVSLYVRVLCVLCVLMCFCDAVCVIVVCALLFFVFV